MAEVTHYKLYSNYKQIDKNNLILPILLSKKPFYYRARSTMRNPILTIAASELTHEVKGSLFLFIRPEITARVISCNTKSFVMPTKRIVTYKNNHCVVPLPVHTSPIEFDHIERTLLLSPSLTLPVK